MTAAAIPASVSSQSLRPYTILIGILGILTFIGGGFGEAYVPGQLIVSGDAASTARNILGRDSFFRLGFAAYMLEAFCDAGLTMAFWVLVRHVHREAAMAMVVFRIISTCGFAAAMMLHFGTLQTLKATNTLGAFTPDQVAALAFTFQRVGGFGAAFFSAFYGIANIIFGVLLYRSAMLPRVFGVLMTIMGVAFVTQTMLIVLAPGYSSAWLLVTAAVAFFPLILWLLVKGVHIAPEHYRLRSS
jgi:hypothetical protein